MKRRQTAPQQWLIMEAQPSPDAWSSVRRLPLGTGILLLTDLSPSKRRRLRYLATARALTIADEDGGAAARVHNARELRQALFRRTPVILLSPIYSTGSHPDWRPLPRMRAAALARLGRRSLFALGGMDAKRYAKIARLGFVGWAGISAFRT